MIGIENNSISLIEKEDIKNYNAEDIKHLIYTIRGKQVMLDSDVACLYKCETKYINRVVKRNIERFPEEFCFQLSFEEQKYGGRRYLPYVFTEQGIAMISALIKSEIAIKVSISIMKAFIEMRKFLLLNGQVFERLTNIEYPILEIDRSNKFHDRFIVIDNIEIYHVGASLKDLGKKCFALTKIEDNEYVNKLIKYK